MLPQPNNMTSLINTTLLICLIVLMGIARVIDVAESRNRWAKVETFIDDHNAWHTRCDHYRPVE